MVPKTPEAIGERGTDSTKHTRLSSRAKEKRKVIEVLAVVLAALMALVYASYQSKLVLGRPIERGFWAFTIFIGIWLIIGVVQVLRKTNHGTDKRNPSVQDRGSLEAGDRRDVF